LKILITGIAGFLGSHLADRFLAEGHEVSGVDSLSGGDAGNVPHGARWTASDCGCWTSMEKALKGIDVVYHTACTAYEGLSVFSPSIIVRNTSGITATVLSASIAQGVKRFVYCSSMSRYGFNDTPFREEYRPRPQDPYAIAKVASEQLIANLAPTFGYEYVIAVPHNIIGPRQRHYDPYRNVAAIMINCMLQGEQPVIYGDGTQMRCFSFISDVVDVLAQFATDERVSGEVFNVGPDEEAVTINQLAETIAGLLDFELQPRYFPDRPQEVRQATCSADKIREWFGYETQVGLKDGLQQMIDYIRPRVRKFEYHLPIEIQNDKTPRTWTERLF